MLWLLVKSLDIIRLCNAGNPQVLIIALKSIIVVEIDTCGSSPTSLDSNYLAGVPQLINRWPLGC